jgi:hypothetical protein
MLFLKETFIGGFRSAMAVATTKKTDTYCSDKYSACSFRWFIVLKTLFAGLL